MFGELRSYAVRVTKRDTGEVIEGTMKWDGIASLYAITTEDGETRYASCLDSVEKTPLDKSES